MQRCHNYKINCRIKISKEHCRYSTHKKNETVGGCQLRRTEVGEGGGGGGVSVDVNEKLKLCEMQKKSRGGWGQGGHERRIEVVKMQKYGGSGPPGVRVDVYENLK